MKDLVDTVINADVHRALANVVARRNTLTFIDDRAVTD
jgi:hypothetical protein